MPFCSRVAALVGGIAGYTTYPLKDLLHTHAKNGLECTVLTTRCTDSAALSNYGVVVVDEKTGRVRHFVYRPQTFVSDVINAGVLSADA